MGYADVEAARQKLLKDAKECGYDISERSDYEHALVRFLAEMYLFQEVDDDTFNAFRTGEQGDGPLNPNADYEEFFTAALLGDFEAITDRRPNMRELGLFDDEVVSWISYNAEEERKASLKDAANDDVEYPEEAFRAFA